MATPCGKCGATKTDPAGLRLLYKLAKALGLRLRRCANCKRIRFLRWDLPLE
jgi:hypothetical protein